MSTHDIRDSRVPASLAACAAQNAVEGRLHRARADRSGLAEFEPQNQAGTHASASASATPRPSSDGFCSGQPAPSAASSSQLPASITLFFQDAGDNYRCDSLSLHLSLIHGAGRINVRVTDGHPEPMLPLLIGIVGTPAALRTRTQPPGSWERQIAQRLECVYCSIVAPVPEPHWH